MKTFHRILLATDFSECSRRAFEEALELARGGGCELIVVHAYQPPSLLPMDIASVPSIYSELDESLRDAAGKQLAAVALEARARGIAATDKLLSGTPEGAILEEAKRSGADLIVLGTVGRRGLSGLLLGSVASRVAAAAPCPVLTVRPETPARSAPP